MEGSLSGSQADSPPIRGIPGSPDHTGAGGYG